MQRKNKAMIAAAIGMVAIVVATTAVRCSIAHTAGQADADPPAASLEQPAEQEGPETEPEAGEETDGASAVLEELRVSAWTAADGSGKTLAFREGSFVESDGASVSMTAFEVEGSGSSGAQRWLDVLLLKDGDAAGESATIVLDEDDEVSSVACDGFSLSGRYVRTATSGGTVEVTGLAEPYPSLVDGRTDERSPNGPPGTRPPPRAPPSTGRFSSTSPAGASAPRSIWTTTPRRSSPRSTDPASSPSSVRRRR